MTKNNQKEKRINDFISFARSYDHSLEVIDRDIENWRVQIKTKKQFSLLWFLVLLWLIYWLYYLATKETYWVLMFDEDWWFMSSRWKIDFSAIRRAYMKQNAEYKKVATKYVGRFDGKISTGWAIIIIIFIIWILGTVIQLLK